MTAKELRKKLEEVSDDAVVVGDYDGSEFEFTRVVSGTISVHTAKDKYVKGMIFDFTVKGRRPIESDYIAERLSDGRMEQVEAVLIT
jgi:hypothetical protein